MDVSCRADGTGTAGALAQTLRRRNHFTPWPDAGAPNQMRPVGLPLEHPALPGEPRDHVRGGPGVLAWLDGREGAAAGKREKGRPERRPFTLSESRGSGGGGGGAAAQAQAGNAEAGDHQRP